MNPFLTPTLANVAVLAQATGEKAGAGLSTGAVETVSLSLLVLLCILGWYCVKHLNAKFVHGLVFMAIGVVGAKSVIGQFIWMVINIGIKVVTGIELG